MTPSPLWRIRGKQIKLILQSDAAKKQRGGCHQALEERKGRCREKLFQPWPFLSIVRRWRNTLGRFLPDRKKVFRPRKTDLLTFYRNPLPS
jgi:hypothetical protein